MAAALLVGARFDVCRFDGPTRAVCFEEWIFMDDRHDATVGLWIGCHALAHLILHVEAECPYRCGEFEDPEAELHADIFARFLLTNL